MRGESEVGVESDPPDLGSPAQFEVGPLPGDMQACWGLVGVRGEKSTGGLSYGYSSLAAGLRNLSSIG